MKKLILLILIAFLLTGCVNVKLSDLPFKLDGNADKNVLKPSDKNLQVPVKPVTDKNNQVDLNLETKVDVNAETKVDLNADKNIQPKPVEKKTFTLKISVKDSANAVVSGASVSVNSNNALTDENGLTSFSLLEGTYTVTVSKEGFNSSPNEKTLDKNDELNVVLEKPVPQFKPIKWKKTVNDGSISLEPAGFLKIQQGERRLKLAFVEGVSGELSNKAFEWRLKILEGTSTGFPLTVLLYSPSKKLFKVNHATERVKIVGKNSEEKQIDLKSDYHTFKFVINAEEKGSLFVDGATEPLISGVLATDLVPTLEPSHLLAENYKSKTSLDYFYIDSENDGTWDYQENWDSMDNVS